MTIDAMVPAPSAILLQLLLSACVSASLHHTTGAGAGLKHVYGIAPFYSSASIPVSARHARSSVHLWPQCSRPAHTTQSRRSARPVMSLSFPVLPCSLARLFASSLASRGVVRMSVLALACSHARDFENAHDERRSAVERVGRDGRSGSRSESG
eukprot:6179093-Pleurochrysis_carterae.AAC.4